MTSKLFCGRVESGTLIPQDEFICALSIEFPHPVFLTGVDAVIGFCIPAADSCFCTRVFLTRFESQEGVGSLG
jgi:hypothetical protein